MPFNSVAIAFCAILKILQHRHIQSGISGAVHADGGTIHFRIQNLDTLISENKQFPLTKTSESYIGWVVTPPTTNPHFTRRLVFTTSWNPAVSVLGGLRAPHLTLEVPRSRMPAEKTYRSSKPRKKCVYFTRRLVSTTLWNLSNEERWPSGRLHGRRLYGVKAREEVKNYFFLSVQKIIFVVSFLILNVVLLFLYPLWK
jgi:hypothetical protein